MSTPSMPNKSHLASDKARAKRKDRPPTLQFGEPQTSSDGDVQYERDMRAAGQPAPLLQVRNTDELAVDSESDMPRPESATSALDPYYFSIPSPAQSPFPHALSLPKTPELRNVHDPVTPGKDPASIDRRGLVGVGELATPRWARSTRDDEVEIDEPVHEADEDDIELVAVADEYPQDLPDSPWTIEAIDGEKEGDDEFLEVKTVPRLLRSQRSAADESGGEEILYPRHPPMRSDSIKRERPHTAGSVAEPSAESAVAPPSSFVPSRPKKRTSDEFEMDQSGTLVSKSAEEKAAIRRHKSLGVGSPSSAAKDKVKDRRRDTLSVHVKHARQTSASSSSSSPGENHPARRVHGQDFSHLPPSPSTSSIQQFLKRSNSNSAVSSPPHTAREPSTLATNVVAHSLLRGTQEGWSDLDDQTTAEALRKLDGLSSRSAHARSSVGGHSRLGSISRPTSRPNSRPSTPGGAVAQWEGIEAGRSAKRMSTHASSALKEKEREKTSDQTPTHRQQSVGLGLGLGEGASDGDNPAGARLSSEEHNGSPVPDKSLKKAGSAHTRMSFTPKRSSASSGTTSTPTTSSRDSAGLSIATSATSVSGASGRQSTSKTRRNSASSDVSVYSGDASLAKDRAVLLTEATDEAQVPPVPPLPKDFSGYKLGPQSPASLASPSSESGSGTEKKVRRDTVGDVNHLTVHRGSPAYPTTPSKHASLQVPKADGPATPGNLQKTPSKKWSLNALGKKLSSSPSVTSMKDSSTKSPSFPISPRGMSFTQQIRRSMSKDNALANASKSSGGEWSQPEAMASATSLASMSSIGSGHGAASSAASLHPPHPAAHTPEQDRPSRAGTASSASTNVPLPPQPPLSPPGANRSTSTKRRTPSSIPFFRRSSSQSMQYPASAATMPMSASPTSSTGPQSSTHLRVPNGRSPTKENAGLSSPTSAHKKSSVLSLGLPSLLKGSSSRRSLHSDKEKSDAKSGKETSGSKDSDRERSKKDDRDRSESRISVLMGRKRGKTLSSVTPKKPSSPVAMPPLQLSALPTTTAQRVANMKPSSSSSSSNPGSTPAGSRLSSSRATSQTVSSMQKQSDTSLRSRTQLPTIAGSPSVGTLQQPTNTKESRERDGPPSTAFNPTASLSKETPTKIPRISSRSSAANSPTMRNNGASRRLSVIANSSTAVSSSRGSSPVGGNDSINEFGVLENGQASSSKVATSSQRHSVRTSPSSSSRVPRQASGNATTVNGTTHRKNRESMSFVGLRKSSTGSVASISSVAQQHEQPVQHRFSALSPSKGIKLLSPKMSLPTSKSSNSSSAHNTQQGMASPTVSRQSHSTPSPAPSSVDEEELLGDEEMLQYIRRQQAKKLAAGASQEDLDNLLRFPEPTSPTPSMTPNAVIKSYGSQLSEYEHKEVLDYPSVYVWGARSDKKPATCDNSTNNHGYDDERGDYLIVNGDHLAYRYEVIDTLGKGSFGQVLNCRDHCTGESVAIKIIRNKKRFHHQALVEIKILDSLRKWDQDEKHHVIKMTEHFYFRSHLCIAMELLSINLYELIKANGFVGFTTSLIRRFTSQMLHSLALMRHHRIVHCDLKPENVLLKHPAKSAIKVIDFGSSCFEHEKIYTYIQSRFYRSPEVILGMNYHMAIDMWSLGCILAELYTGFPIFPGENEQEQLSCIMEVLGVPDKDFVNRSSRKRLFFDTTGAPRPVVNSKGRRRRPGSKSLAQVLRCDDELFVDFISKCLVWDPERRIKPQAALRHPFVTAGRRAKITSPTPGTAKAALSSSSRSSKPLTETPKKSMISAPTPLTARSSRTTMPSTPSGSTSMTLGSSRSYRTSQAQSLSSYHSSRTMTAK